MNLAEIQMEKKNILQEIINILPSFQKMAEKSIDEITEIEYKELERLNNIFLEIFDKTKVLDKEKEQREAILEKVKQGEKIAPLVPVEDIVDGLTKEKFEKLKEEYEALCDFYNSEDYKKFMKLHDKIWTLKHDAREKLGKEKNKRDLEKKVEDVKKIIMSPSIPQGTYVVTMHPQNKRESNYTHYEGDKRYVSEKVRILYEKYKILPPWMDVRRVEYLEDIPHCRDGHTYTAYKYSYLRFVPYRECDLHGKQECKLVEERINQIKNSNEEKYDKPGKISLEISHEGEKQTIEIEMTQRELANAGILPEDLGWMDKTQVSSKNIADASKGLAMKKVGGIRGFLTKLLDKFNGKGEK